MCERLIALIHVHAFALASCHARASVRPVVRFPPPRGPVGPTAHRHRQRTFHTNSPRLTDSMSQQGTAARAREHSGTQRVKSEVGHGHTGTRENQRSSLVSRPRRCDLRISEARSHLGGEIASRRRESLARSEAHELRGKSPLVPPLSARLSASPFPRLPLPSRARASTTIWSHVGARMHMHMYMCMYMRGPHARAAMLTHMYRLVLGAVARN